MKERMSSPASERAILAGLFNHGIDAHIDVDDLISAETFTSERNQIIYSCLEKVFEKSQTVDIPSIISVSSTVSLVVPGIEETIARSSFNKAFSKEDFPALGLPAIATGTPFFITRP